MLAQPISPAFQRFYALANHDISEAAIDDMIRRKLYAAILTGAIDESPNATGQIDFAAANTFAQDAEERDRAPTGMKANSFRSLQPKCARSRYPQILPPSSQLTALSISPLSKLGRDTVVILENGNRCLRRGRIRLRLLWKRGSPEKGEERLSRTSCLARSIPLGSFPSHSLRAIKTRPHGGQMEPWFRILCTRKSWI